MADPTPPKAKHSHQYVGVGLVFGAGLGVVIGAATGYVGLGISRAPWLCAAEPR